MALNGLERPKWEQKSMHYQAGAVESISMKGDYMKKYQIAVIAIWVISALFFLIADIPAGYVSCAIIAVILTLVWRKKQPYKSNGSKPESCSSPSVAPNISAPEQSQPEHPKTPTSFEFPRSDPKGHISYIINLDYIKQCEKKFIAFDLETTGLDPSSDRIVEISAVVFENFSVTSKFTTLVNPKRPIPAKVSRINGIYDKDVATAPTESEAINSFCAFIGQETLSGEIVLVAHNAPFDVKFLLYAFSRSGIDAEICFQDTLCLSKNIALPVENYKLCTLAEYFNLKQEHAHRAEDDALVCGELFVRLLKHKQQEHESKLNALSPLEKDVCLWIKRALEEADCNTDLLTFNSSAYLAVNCLYTVIKFKPKARRPYVLVSGKIQLPTGLESAPTTKSEGDGFVRVFFQQPSDLDPLRDFIVKRYSNVFNQAMEYLSESDRRMKEAAKTADSQICI